MLIKNCVKNENGGYDFDFYVDENECSFLMDFAIKSLIRTGLLSVALEQAEQEVELFKQSGGELQ